MRSGGGAAAVIVDVFESPNDPHRIERLPDDVRALWPFENQQEYVLDVSIQTAEGTRSFPIPPSKAPER